MRKIYGLIMMAMLLFGTTAITASAQGFYMPRQQARIRQGVINGTISRAHAARLQERISRLYEFERQANADGYVDERERQIIDEERYSIARELDPSDTNPSWQYEYRHDRW